jgi:hypothetical protein
MMNLVPLHDALVATCRKVVGVSVPDESDKSTWIVQYDPEPTDAEIAAVESVIASYSTGPDTTDVDAERDRRIAQGVTITLADGTVIPVQTRDDVDFRNLNGLSTAGLALQLQGSTQMTVFRDAENNGHSLTPAQLVELGMKVAAAIQAVYARSWALKGMSPIPDDYAADKYWA